MAEAWKHDTRIELEFRIRKLHCNFVPNSHITSTQPFQNNLFKAFQNPDLTRMKRLCSQNYAQGRPPSFETWTRETRRRHLAALFARSSALSRKGAKPAEGVQNPWGTLRKLSKAIKPGRITFCLSIYLSIYLSVYLSSYLSTYLSYPLLSSPLLSSPLPSCPILFYSYLSIYLSILYIYVSIYIYMYIYICIYIYTHIFTYMHTYIHSYIHT